MTTGHSHSHSDSHSHSHHHDHDVTVELDEEPRFDPGQRVRLNRAVIEKYKRRPEYAEGADGVVEQVRGAYLPPTATDEIEGEYLYSVRFRPRQIWGDDHPEKNGSVYIDVWEDALDER
jgi:nitrile hydratase